MIDLLDLHTHTIASGHPYNTLYEMAQSAAEKGLALYGCSEHAPAMPGSCHKFYFSNFDVIPRVIRGIPVLMGTELNILDHTGRVDLEDHYLQKIDYAIASLHTPCIDNHGTVSDYTNAYLGVMENPLIHIIGHPDDSRLPADWTAVAAAAAKHHKLLELNSHSLAPNSSRKGARENYEQLLTACMRYGTSIIIDSDAHCENDVGNHEMAHRLLADLHFPEELVVNTSLSKAAAFIPSLDRLLKEEPELFYNALSHPQGGNNRT